MSAPLLPGAEERVAQRFARLHERPVILEIRDLSKSYASAQGNVEALRSVSFEVRRRELLCVIGASGCGKSTLVRILAGLEAPTSGQVLLEGVPVAGPGRDRGMVFQGYTLFPWLTVRGNVAFALEMAGTSRFQAQTEAREWIALVGLEKFEEAYPHQLSGGMKQRVAIARALAARPRVLLMDEPFGALDAQTRAQMQAHLLQIWRNIDITIVFITHDLDEAAFLADRVLVLDPRPGRVRERIEVPVPRPRSLDQIPSPVFQETRRYLDHLVHPPSAPLASIEKLPFERLTLAGDDIE